MINALAAEYDGKIVVGKLNIDDYPDIKDRYSIEGYPSFLVFKDGELKRRIVGMRSKQTLSDLLMALQ